MEMDTEITVIEPPPEFPAEPPRSCCIGGCSSTNEKSKSEHLLFMPSPSLSFFKMPSQPFGLRQAWINIIRASRSEPEWLPDDNVFVCNLHFHPHEIVIPVDETTAQIDFSDGKNIVPSLRLGDYGVTKIGDNDDEDDTGGNDILDDVNFVKGDLQTSFNFIPMKVKEEPKSEDEYDDSSLNHTFDDEQPCSSSSIIKPGKRKPKPTWSLRELWDDDEERGNEREENDSSEYEPSSDSDSDSDTERRRNRNRARDGDYDDGMDDDGILNSSKRPKLSTPSQKFILQSSNNSVNSCVTPKTHNAHKTPGASPSNLIRQKQLFRPGGHSVPNKVVQSGSNPNFLNFQLKTLGQVNRSPGAGMTASSQFIQQRKMGSLPSSTPTTANLTFARKRTAMPHIPPTDPIVELVTLMQQIQSKNRTTLKDSDFYDQCIALFNKIFDRLKNFPPSETKKNISLQLSVLVDIAKQRKNQGNSTANQVHFSLVSKKILEILFAWPKDPQTRPPVIPNTSTLSNIRINAKHIVQAVQKSNSGTAPGLRSPPTTTPYGHMTKLMENKFSLNSGTGNQVRVTTVQDVAKGSNLLSSKNLINLQRSAAANTTPSPLKPMPHLTRKGSTSQEPEIVTLSDDDDEDDSGFSPLIESVTTLAPGHIQSRSPMPSLASSPSIPKTPSTPTPVHKNNSNMLNNRRTSQPASDTSPVKVIHSSTVLEKFAQFTKFVLDSEVPPPLSADQAQTIHWMGHEDMLDPPEPNDPHSEQDGMGTGPAVASTMPTLPLGKYPPNVPIVISSVPKDQVKQIETQQQQPVQKQPHPSPNQIIAAGIRNALKISVSQNQSVGRNGPRFTLAGTGGTRFSSPATPSTVSNPRASMSALFSQQLRHLAAHTNQNPAPGWSGPAHNVNGSQYQHQYQYQTNNIMAQNLVDNSTVAVGSLPSSGIGLPIPGNNNVSQRIVLVTKGNGAPTYAIITTPSSSSQTYSSSGLNRSDVNTIPIPSPYQAHQQVPLLRPPVPVTGPVPGLANHNNVNVQQKISVVQRKPNADEEIILLSDDSDEESQISTKNRVSTTTAVTTATIATSIMTTSNNFISLNSKQVNTVNSMNALSHVNSTSGSSAIPNLNYCVNPSTSIPGNSVVSENASLSVANPVVAGIGPSLEDQSVFDDEMLLGI